MLHKYLSLKLQLQPPVLVERGNFRVCLIGVMILWGSKGVFAQRRCDWLKVMMKKSIASWVVTRQVGSRSHVNTQSESQLYSFEHNEAVIKMINKG